MSESARKKHSLLDWIRFVEGRIRRAAREGFFGRITIEFMRGDIVRIEVSESIKEPVTEPVASGFVEPVVYGANGAGQSESSQEVGGGCTPVRSEVQGR